MARRIRLKLEKADAGRTNPIIEFVPSMSKTDDEHDYFWVGDSNGTLLGTIGADDLYEFVDRARSMRDPAAV